MILVLIRGFQEPVDTVFMRNFAIVSRGDIICAQLFGLFEKGAEFDFPVAEHVGIRRSARLVFGEKIGKDSVEILF